jgi:hypothetical protein
LAHSLCAKKIEPGEGRLRFASVGRLDDGSGRRQRDGNVSGQRVDDEIAAPRRQSIERLSAELARCAIENSSGDAGAAKRDERRARGATGADDRGVARGRLGDERSESVDVGVVGDDTTADVDEPTRCANASASSLNGAVTDSPFGANRSP